MQQTAVSAAWERGEAVLNFWLSTGSPVNAEIAAGHDFDALTIDLQHGLADYADGLAMLHAMRGARATPLARVPWLEPGIIMKLLDAGALGLICPMVNSAEQAERFVRYSKYPPEGERSFGPTRARPLYGDDYPGAANSQVITLAMVETRLALDQVDEIAGTPGLSGVYIGPSDLAAFLGHPPRPDQEQPEVMSAIERILAAAKSAGIKAGIHCLAPAYAARMIDLGFDLVTLGSDVNALSAGLSALTKAMGR